MLVMGDMLLSLEAHQAGAGKGAGRLVVWRIGQHEEPVVCVRCVCMCVYICVGCVFSSLLVLFCVVLTSLIMCITPVFICAVFNVCVFVLGVFFLSGWWFLILCCSLL